MPSRSVCLCGYSHGLSRAVASLLLSVLFLATGSVQAQSSDRLTHDVPVEGILRPGFADAWQFTARDGEMLSFRLEAIEPRLDPIIEIQRANGDVLARNDDYNYPESRDSLIEAYTFPATGIFRVSVSGYAGTGGAYRLTMTPGYSQISYQTDFSTGVDWQTPETTAGVTASDQAMQVAVEGVDVHVPIFASNAAAKRDGYYKVNLRAINARPSWRVGMILRYHEALDTYYSVQINESGNWRFIRVSGTDTTVLRDWRTHPAIVPGITEFSLGVLALGVGFDLFYNGQYIGSLTDDTHNRAGLHGVSVTSANAIGSQISATFDDFIITQPQQVNGAPIFPARISATGAGGVTVRELQRRQVIPMGGEMALTLNSSSARLGAAGVLRFPITGGTLYGNLVLGGTVAWDNDGSGANGCGLALRSPDAGATYDLAYVDSDGGYGLAHYAGDAAGFTDGIYGHSHDIGTGPYHLVVVAAGQMLHYFIEGHYVGELATSALNGEIGQTVINFDPLNTQCRFENIWLWQW